MTGTTNKSSRLVTVSEVRLRINRRKVLEIPHFSVGSGEHWCVFGGNGSGKSLLARLLRGELPRARRQVDYGEGFEPARDLQTVSFEEQQRLWALDNRHDISEFNQEATDQGTTVGRLICGRRDPVMLSEERARKVLAVLELDAMLERGIRYLSSGQIRKAMLARALLNRTGETSQLLILDDPLEAIDRQAQPAVRELLTGWMDAGNSTVLLCRRESEILPGITHLALLESLRIVAQGPVGEVTGNPHYSRIARPPPVRPGPVPVSSDSRASTAAPVAPIRLEQVTAAYGDKLVLNRVNWEMAPGQHTLIEGPNGCGKSTLLSLIDGENHKAYGQGVTLFGVRRGSGESVWDIKSHFGVVSNEIHNRYVKGWRVAAVVVSGFYDSVGLYDDSGATQQDTAVAWLDALGLSGLDREYFHELSFGQQRLVLLARAMVKGPDVLILDEPCVGLDDEFRQRVLAIVDCIAEQSATQMVYVSHTEGEEPQCINQRLRFEPAAGGGFQLVEHQPPAFGASP